MLNVKTKPQRHTAVGSATAASEDMWRSKMVRRALRSEGTAADWIEKRRLYCEIKRLVREMTHRCRQVTVNKLRKTASSISLSEIAARITKIHNATDAASRLGDEFKPSAFTEFFADKPAPKTFVALRKYTLPGEMENSTGSRYEEQKRGKRLNRTVYRWKFSRYAWKPLRSYCSSCSLPE